MGELAGLVEALLRKIAATLVNVRAGGSIRKQDHCLNIYSANARVYPSINPDQLVRNLESQRRHYGLARVCFALGRPAVHRPCLKGALRRQLFFGVVMLLANVAIKGMDEKNRTLSFGGGARVIDGFMLTAMDRGSFVTPCGHHSPLPFARHNMLISAGFFCFCRNLRRGDALCVVDTAVSLMNDEIRT